MALVEVVRSVEVVVCSPARRKDRRTTRSSRLVGRRVCHGGQRPRVARKDSVRTEQEAAGLPVGGWRRRATLRIPPNEIEATMSDDDTTPGSEPPAASEPTAAAGSPNEAPAGPAANEATQPEVAPAGSERPGRSLPEETPQAASTNAGAPAGTAPAAATTSSDRPGVFVPRWAAILIGCIVALLLVGGGGFALGRATDDDHDHDGRPNIEARGGIPRGPNGRGIPFPFPIPGGPDGPGNGGGQGGGNGGGQQTNRRVLLGVSAETATGDVKGARITTVVPDSPAQQAGIQTGDIVTKVDDTDITTAADLVDAVSSHKSGDEVTLVVSRDGTTKTIKVTLGNITPGGGGAGSSSSSTD
jgi:membrane-associated protease RseP (regulator of RpoE activity)